MIESAAIETPQDLLGSVVIPKRGRDSGRPGVIVGWLDEGEFALVADGRLRPVSKPKKKNMKHLIFTKCRPRELYLGFLTGERITDRMIRKELAAFGEQTGIGRQYG